MDKQQLDEILRELHNELRQTKSVDENERRILQQLMADIQEILEQREYDQAYPYNRFDERIKNAIEEFGVSHPRITTLMGQIADMLSRIGI
jgi:predicted XRE-type DNA-binding protein